LESCAAGASPSGGNSEREALSANIGRYFSTASRDRDLTPLETETSY